MIVLKVKTASRHQMLEGCTAINNTEVLYVFIDLSVPALHVGCDLTQKTATTKVAIRWS